MFSIIEARTSAEWRTNRPADVLHNAEPAQYFMNSPQSKFYSFGLHFENFIILFVTYTYIDLHL